MKIKRERETHTHTYINQGKNDWYTLWLKSKALAMCTGLSCLKFFFAKQINCKVQCPKFGPLKIDKLRVKA